MDSFRSQEGAFYLSALTAASSWNANKKLDRAQATNDYAQVLREVRVKEKAVPRKSPRIWNKPLLRTPGKLAFQEAVV